MPAGSSPTSTRKFYRGRPLGGAIDAMVFENYIERCLAPSLRPDDFVTIDNFGSRADR